MVSLYNIIVILLFVGLLRYKTQLIHGPRDLFYLSVAGAGLILVSAVRYEEVGDFASNSSSWYRIGRLPFDELLKEPEPGAALFRWVVARFTDDAQWFFAVSATFIVGSFLIFFYRYSKDVRLSLFLFVTLGYYFSSHNIMLQYVGSAMWLWSLPFLVHRKPIRYLIICFISVSIHTATIFLVPLYWLARVRLRPVTIVVYLLLVGIGLAWFPRLLGFLQRWLYSDFDPTSYGMTPADPLNIIPPLSLLLAILLFRAWSEPVAGTHQVITQNSRIVESPYLGNAMLHSSILAVAMATFAVSQILLAHRVSLLFSVAFLVLVPNSLRSLPKRHQNVAYTIIVLMAAIYFILRNVAGSLTPTPYTPFWAT